jgi:hypothetical protein
MTNKAKYEELKRIAKEHRGILRPATVVKEAEPEDSPLHGCFCWDDTKAAHEFRLEQARKLIRVVLFIEPNSNTEQQTYVSLSTDRKLRGGGYRLLSHVMTDKDKRMQLLADALAELNAFKLKYANLKELAGVFEAIRKVRA